MAERRMFTKKVTDDDNFMELSASAQALYLHLTMAADDDGFCNQITICMFKAHASISDLEALLEKRYIYQFENGVIVIKHWRMANALRKDRYTTTAFQEELKKLGLKKNKSYTLLHDEISEDDEQLPSGCQVVADCLPQSRVDKSRLDKIRLEQDNIIDSDESEPSPPAKKVKHKYGEYNNVLLTDEELQKLKTEYSDYQDRIERLSAYVESTGKRYKSHYATIRNWARKDAEVKPINKPIYQKQTKADELDEFYRMAAEFGEGGE